MSTTEIDAITMTTADLDKHLRNYRIKNPHMSDDLRSCIEAGIQYAFPNATIEEVFVQCEINSMREADKKKTRDIARDPDRWIDTTVQGDFFRDAIRLPPHIEVNGIPKKIETANPSEIEQFLLALEQSKRVQATAMSAASEECLRHAEIIAVSAKKNRAVIDAAAQHGVNVAGGIYAAAD